MDPIVDVAGMIAATPGGALGIFVVAPTVFSVVLGVGTKSPPVALGGFAAAMAVCILGLGLSPWWFVLVALTGLASVGVLLTLGWSVR